MKTNTEIKKEVEEEIKSLERQKRFKNGLKLVAVVGIGAGLYGFKLGHRIGLTKGIEVGYIVAGKDMIEALREHAEELRLSRGE